MSCPFPAKTPRNKIDVTGRGKTKHHALVIDIRPPAFIAHGEYFERQPVDFQLFASFAGVIDLPLCRTAAWKASAGGIGRRRYAVPLKTFAQQRGVDPFDFYPRLDGGGRQAPKWSLCPCLINGVCTRPPNSCGKTLSGKVLLFPPAVDRDLVGPRRLNHVGHHLPGTDHRTGRAVARDETVRSATERPAGAGQFRPPCDCRQQAPRDDDMSHESVSGGERGQTEESVAVGCDGARFSGLSARWPRANAQNRRAVGR